MNQDGCIRELAEDEEAAADEVVISRELASELRKLTEHQRRRFYASFKATGDENRALNVARSRP